MKLKKQNRKKDKEIEFKKFLSKNKFKISNIKNYDSLELIRFSLLFEKNYKKKLNIIEIRNKKIDFFLKKIQ